MVDLSPTWHMPLRIVIMSQTDTNPVLKPLFICTLLIQGPMKCGPLPCGSLWADKFTGSWKVPSNLPEEGGLQPHHLESLLLLSAPLFLILKTRQWCSAQAF